MKRVWKMFTRLWMKLNRAAEQSYTTKINAEEQSRASAQTHQFPWWQGRRKG